MTRRLPDGTWSGLLGAALTLSHRLEAEMDRALAVVPLSARGFAALNAIAAGPIPTQAHLASRLGLEPSTTSELLGRLARQRLVRRNPARRGGSRTVQQRKGPAVVLTGSGEAVLAAAERIASKVEDDWARRLNRGEQTPVPGMRAYGLRRWLLESLAALSGTTRSGG